MNRPKKVGDCRGPGICPLVSCRWNVLLDVKRNYDARNRLASETISIVGVRKVGLRSGPSVEVSEEKIDAFVDLLIKKADRLPSTCALDYVDDQDAIPHRNDWHEEGRRSVVGIRPHLTVYQLAELYGVSHEGVRIVIEKALAKVRTAAGVEELDPSFVPMANLKRPASGRVNAK